MADVSIGETVEKRVVPKGRVGAGRDVEAAELDDAPPVTPPPRE